MASWTFDVDGGMQKLWIFMAGFLYIFVIMVYLKVQSYKKKVNAPIAAVFKGMYVLRFRLYLIVYLSTYFFSFILSKLSTYLIFQKDNKISALE